MSICRLITRRCQQEIPTCGHEKKTALRSAVGPTLTFSREILLTPPYQAALAEPRHHVGLGYGQEVGLKSSCRTGSSGLVADCVGPIGA